LQLKDIDELAHRPEGPGRLVSLDVERIVEKREAYWVVEKVGEAAETAEETDPR
jgi:hypothetical protein